MITKFNVATLYTIVEEFKLHYKFIGEKSKLPDHSAITCDFNISDCCNVSDAIRTKHRKNRFQLHRIPSDFMARFYDLKKVRIDSNNRFDRKQSEISGMH